MNTVHFEASTTDKLQGGNFLNQNSTPRFYFTTLTLIFDTISWCAACLRRTPLDLFCIYPIGTMIRILNCWCHGGFGLDDVIESIGDGPGGFADPDLGRES